METSCDVCQGNMEFVEENDGAKIKDDSSTRAIADLLQVDAVEVEKTLCSRIVAARGDVINKVHTVSEAVIGRDAFAKVCCSLWSFLIIKLKFG